MPKVTWSIAKSENTTIASHPVISRQMIGHVDNSLCPEIQVDIQMTLVTPTDVVVRFP